VPRNEDRLRSKDIQRWNGHRPNYRLLWGSFYAHMVSRNARLATKQNNDYLKSVRPPISVTNGGRIPSQFAYIEKVLIQEQRTIDDYRKLGVGLILSRYLINVKGLGYEQAHSIIWQWLDKCDQLKR
jgi:hypothetical protein